MRFREDSRHSLEVFATRKARVPQEMGGDLYRDWTRMLTREQVLGGFKLHE